jgi:hypothetical protein
MSYTKWSTRDRPLDKVINTTVFLSIISVAVLGKNKKPLYHYHVELLLGQGFVKGIISSLI